MLLTHRKTKQSSRSLQLEMFATSIIFRETICCIHWIHNGSRIRVWQYLAHHDYDYMGQTARTLSTWIKLKFARQPKVCVHNNQRLAVLYCKCFDMNKLKIFVSLIKWNLWAMIVLLTSCEFALIKCIAASAVRTEKKEKKRKGQQKRERL